jgi:two-component sensor histidine kinase
MLTGLVWILSIAITFVSNALNSPFLSVLLLVVFVTIATFRPLAYWVLAASTLAYSLFYLNAFPELSALNEHLTSTDGSLLYLIGISFSSALLIYVIGQYLYTLHRRLYTEKAEVEKRLNEKEILLKEVHHRVKNNLQTVSSLLRMQGRNIEAGESLNLIQSSQNRVVAMAMVHEMLYMREDLAKIDYRTYVSELGGYLIKSIKGPESKITLRIDIPEIELGIDTAIPLGLLINEAVTNALKYGFRDRETGEISILLERENKTEFVLRIGDNGIGYPESVSYKTTKSLGLKLIHNLSRQLQGTVIRDLSKEGTNYIIRFHELNPSSFHSLA